MNNIEKILSLQNSFIKRIYKESRLNNGKVIVLNFFKSLSEYGELDFKFLLCTENWYEKNKKNINHKFKKIIIVSKEIINKLSFVKTQSEVLGITSHKYNDVDLTQQKNIIILENINDPNNMASIIRSAVAFNIFNFYITKGSVSPYNEKVLRGTVGSFYFANIKIVDDLESEIKNLTKNNFKIFATILNDRATELNDVNFDKKNAIIFGNEAKGISSKIQSLTTNDIYIKINNIDSLNVASAAAITLYKLSKENKCKR